MYTRRELAAKGIDNKLLAALLKSGDLIRLRPGWFAIRSHDANVASAVRDGGVLTCVDALTFHEAWVPPGHDRRLHLRRNRGMRGKNKACTPLVGSLPTARCAVDSVEAALLCAARCLEMDEWIAVCDSYLHSGATTFEDLKACFGDSGAVVREWLGRTDGRCMSGTESMTRVRLQSLGFDVVVQPAIPGVGLADLRVGILVLECDSMLYHSSKEDYERDRRRDRQTMIDGWLTLRLTYDDIIYGWDQTLADIRAITKRDRHRARSREAKALVERSVRMTTSEGTLPSE
ncbi:type IV toxin-antitoxin system AbiEi family antitoxin domain-containing protein [Gordonia hydrophobica]|uniref:Type IV toxin-antitoxin system AbiEi family antitoxin domain-containing protein n=1 Tax=Gordonia hydrophobica TaxID=40516 RepID=A0ABZ2TZ29_9ACTN|nr:type IV toxin-antitoxin system AbiEi family antitoxin domain-containing protein [Gordonia hydrophobica]MBM7369303.1 hypothetical protein [Gordonia hydrophobica]